MPLLSKLRTINNYYGIFTTSNTNTKDLLDNHHYSNIFKQFV
jgi:hypothetical protein